MPTEKVIFTKEPDEIFLKKPLHLNCKVCLKPYVLHIPYEKANDPARDLCDDCIQNLSPDEWQFMRTSIDGDIVL